MDGEDYKNNSQYNVLGTIIENCSNNPITGFYRDGCCNTGNEDFGSHTVCAKMTDEFLNFSKKMGNDLITPNPEYGFPGLVSGNYWCLCAQRWEQARKAGKAPKVRLRSTNRMALKFCDLNDLKKHAVDD